MPTVPNSGSYLTNFSRESEIWFMPIWRDRNGDIIQNTAKGPFPKPQVEPVSVGIIRGSVRKQNYTDADYKTQLNSVNSGTWRSWNAGEAWCAKIRTKEVNEGDVEYTLVRYTVLCCEYGWASVAPDLGYYYLNGSSEPVVFSDENGLPYLGCLDNGDKLASTSDMGLIDFDFKRAVDFSFLGF